MVPERATEAEPRPAELVRALAALAEPPKPEHGALAEALGLPDPPAGAGYAELFTFQLYPYASVHLGPEGMLGGEARDRVAGFWRAVGRVPPPEPDHLSALLGLYAGLLDEAAELEEASASLVARSAGALLHEHVMPWAPLFLARVRELGGSFFVAWAELLAETLAGEAAHWGEPEARSRHLAEAPGLPDPREAGGESFLQGLLAPVRCGMILTRHDLALVARSAGLPLRAGERRYVLEHLLGMDAPAVLTGLAERASTSAALAHSLAADWGSPAEFWVARATAAEALLQDLLAGGVDLLETAGEAGG